jgi:hypothetical protein
VPPGACLLVLTRWSAAAAAAGRGYSESREQKTSDEFLAYAAAGFNNAMVSDRGLEHCNNSNSTADWKASWASIKAQVRSRTRTW